MPVTRMQSERIEILLQLLRKKYTATELLESLNRKMNDLYDDYVGISSRTLANDLDYIKKRYGASIHRPNKADKYYYYEEQLLRNNIELSDEDVDILAQAQTVLQSLHGMSAANDMKRILSKVYSAQWGAEQEQLIAFENHNLAEGIQYVDNLLQAMLHKKVVHITYTGFTDGIQAEFAFSPYFMKEYRGRWFVFGYNHEKKGVYNLNLGGINKLKNDAKANFVPNSSFNPAHYFEYLIGVTVRAQQEPEEIELLVTKVSARYITTKKLISNQETIKEYANGSVKIQLKAYVNYELKQNLLGYGAALQVLKPKHLADDMLETFQKAVKLYKTIGEE